MPCAIRGFPKFEFLVVFLTLEFSTDVTQLWVDWPTISMPPHPRFWVEISVHFVLILLSVPKQCHLSVYDRPRTMSLSTYQFPHFLVRVPVQEQVQAQAQAQAQALA